MKQIFLLIIAVVALVGCGKKGEPPEVVVKYFDFDVDGSDHLCRVAFSD